MAHRPGLGSGLSNYSQLTFSVFHKSSGLVLTSACGRMCVYVCVRVHVRTCMHRLCSGQTYRPCLPGPLEEIVEISVHMDPEPALFQIFFICLSLGCEDLLIQGKGFWGHDTCVSASRPSSILGVHGVTEQPRKALVTQHL